MVSTIVLTAPGSSSTDNFFENPQLVALNGYDYLVSNTTLAGGLTTATTGTPLAGTTVVLSGTNIFGQAVSGTTTTNASGFYSFPGLAPSNAAGYTVTETPPAGDTHLGQTSTTGGAVTTPAATPVVSHIVLTTANTPSVDNFFEIISVSVNGTDYLVSNTTLASGLTTTTTGIAMAGTTVVLSGTDAFGTPVSGSATTDAGGHYSFAGLNPSNAAGYTVTETPPAGDSHLGQTSTTPGAVTTPAATPVVSHLVLTTNGATSVDNFFEITTVSINGNDYAVATGTPLTTTSTGTAIPGTTVMLTGTDAFGTPVTATTSTDAGGSYNFPGLNPSNSSGYTVTETVPVGYTPRGPDLDDAGGHHHPGGARRWSRRSC